jgi:hypothetical protein
MLMIVLNLFGQSFDNNNLKHLLTIMISIVIILIIDIIYFYFLLCKVCKPKARVKKRPRRASLQR